jgi:transposase InsO family protein
MILQSDNGREFTANIITDLKSLWPDLKIVHGRPRHPQSQGSEERANADVKEMLATWEGVMTIPASLTQLNSMTMVSVSNSMVGSLLSVELCAVT